MKLINYKEGQFNSQPDPYIIKAEDGKFYIYVTGVDGVRAFVSDSLLGEYEEIGVVFALPGKKEYWAPSVKGPSGVSDEATCIVCKCTSSSSSFIKETYI